MQELDAQTAARPIQWRPLSLEVAPKGQVLLARHNEPDGWVFWVGFWSVRVLATHWCPLEGPTDV